MRSPDALPVRVLAAVLTGLVAFFLLQAGALAAFVASIAGERGSMAELWFVLARPVLQAALSLGALALLAARRAPGPVAVVAGAAGVAVTLASQVVRPFGGADAAWLLRVVGPFVLAPLGLAFAAGGAWLTGRRAPAAVLLALATGWPLAATHPHDHPGVNRLGLVGAPPGSEVVESYAADPYKDGYPDCTFRYNSLGYRDLEPSFEPSNGRRRVLLIGNSFVWGDGIPTNDQTLGARLRDELERRSPGGFEVMVAAYPALGFYGYERVVATLAPLYRPDVVLVQYAPLHNHTVSDPQFLVDRLPKAPLLADAVRLVDGIRHVNEAFVFFAPALFLVGAGPGARLVGLDGVLPRLARRAAEDGLRAVVFFYDDFGDTPRSRPWFPPPLATLELPKAWRYTGAASELWYGKDYHPRPRLNALVAGLLADEILAPSR